MKTVTFDTITLGTATGTLTLSGNVSDGDTVTIGETVYTFESGSIDTAYEVDIGGTASDSIDNLIHAINGTGTPGTHYGTGTAAHPDVTAAAGVGDTMVVTATVAGLDGNSIATTETSATASWGATTLTGGQTCSISATVTDVTYTQPAQQVTVSEYQAGNLNWSRGVQISSAAVFAKRFGAAGVAVPLASVGKLGYTVEPALTWAPRITTQPADDSCVASSTAADFTVVSTSEPTQTYRWQYESKATNTVTTDNTELADGDTVTVNGQAYRFKDTPAQAYDVKRHGTTADTTLLNFIKAVNASGVGDGSDYYAGTTAHPTVQADSAVSSHAVTLRARTSGTGGNALTLAKSAAHLSVGAATFSGGGTWASAAGTILDCAYTNDTTATLTATPTSTRMSGTEHRVVITNSAGSTTSDAATLTIT